MLAVTTDYHSALAELADLGLWPIVDPLVPATIATRIVRIGARPPRERRCVKRLLRHGWIDCGDDARGSVVLCYVDERLLTAILAQKRQAAALEASCAQDDPFADEATERDLWPHGRPVSLEEQRGLTVEPRGERATVRLDGRRYEWHSGEIRDAMHPGSRWTDLAELADAVYDNGGHSGNAARLDEYIRQQCSAVGVERRKADIAKYGRAQGLPRTQEQREAARLTRANAGARAQAREMKAQGRLAQALAD